MSSTKQEGSSRADIGEPAPDFELKDQEGRAWRLSDHRGKVVALIFYPKDETPVCTKQMCSIRDRWEDYSATGAEVAGISVGPVESHKSFAENHDLPQRLLADEQAQVTGLYNLKSMFGRSQRAVVVIDPKGILRYRRSVFPIFRQSDDEVLEAIRDAASSS
jgi:peroxiredoxin Q/BCP